MIGDMLSKIREDKQISKTNLSKETNINVGHLTHIEKGERNPSHKALKSLCDALDVPYQPLMYTYDKKLTQEQIGYDIVNHIKYDTIPVVNSISGFAKCPKEYNSASVCLRVNDKDVGLFEYENKFLIRKFIVRMNDLVLRAEKDEIADIIITSKDRFNIIGKVLGKAE